MAASASILRFQRPQEEKASLLPSFVTPPPVPVLAPVLCSGPIPRESGGESKLSEFEHRILGGVQLVLFRNLHRAEAEGISEPELHKMWLSFMSDSLHLVWVSKSGVDLESKMESINLGRVINVDEEEVKIKSVSLREIRYSLVTMKTPTQKFGLAVVREEDFKPLKSCMLACVETSAKTQPSSSQSPHLPFHGDHRRGSLMSEHFSTDEMLRIGVGPTSSHEQHSARYASVSTRRGSHGAVSVSSSSDGGVQDFGRVGTGGGGGDEGGQKIRPVARLEHPVDHMEVV
eukprot:CAMPEP_0182480214 /NCGR_PEP_ID=MMETSP1319-20130603/35424_1 /TAXON_ID=172717 /ORGANISM="Bolidomonas pacifica, Strain RCC208" /LENGTH=287 /DNA_ID=CAMNT_0024681689 /DNA_START=92 /DNA_END=952 /DNA_ORIENTATION=-